MPRWSRVARHATARRAVAWTAVLLASSLGPPPAVAAPARVVTAELRGTTTISWTGNAAIRLRVPKNVMVPPEASYRFTVRTGRFVSVRAFENPQPIGCRADYQQDWCAGIWLDWLRDLAETSGHGVFTDDPAGDFLYGVNDPPVVRRGSWDLYLFTDGRATLEITARGLAGRAAYVAGGRSVGQAVLGKGPCRLAACPVTGPVHADQRTGGAAFDVGRAGMVQALVYGAIERRDPAPGVPAGQQFALRACRYPNPLAPDASTEPRDHPAGCDAPSPAAPIDGAVGTAEEVASGGPSVFTARYGAGTYETRGRVYLGFRASSAGPSPARLGALLIWLRYGIR